MEIRAYGCVESLEQRWCPSSVGWDGPGLGSASLTYFLDEVPEAIGREEFRAAIEQAFRVWTDIADIEMSETDIPNQRDSIDIDFRQLDGPGGTLAQAFLPDDVNRGRRAGDVTFDSDDSWEFGDAQGRAATDLLLVAVHEIGHALGLEHSDDPDDVMFPSVRASQSFVGLSSGDVDAILSLYAPRPVTLFGDVSDDGELTSLDIDLLAENLRAGVEDERFDLSGDGAATREDYRILVQVAFNTDYGDANLDGIFDSNDLTSVFQFGLYEKSNPSIASWVAGDWNGDGRFDSADLILALQTGRYAG